MSEAVLNLNTRVIETKRRSTIKRTDFEIAGDSMRFNTATHQGTMTGNVHMTIFNQEEIAAGPTKK
jgi:lipopolysaccharide export system protein LptC